MQQYSAIEFDTPHTIVLMYNRYNPLRGINAAQSKLTLTLLLERPVRTTSQVKLVQAQYHRFVSTIGFVGELCLHVVRLLLLR